MEKGHIIRKGRIVGSYDHAYIYAMNFEYMQKPLLTNSSGFLEECMIIILDASVLFYSKFFEVIRIRRAHFVLSPINAIQLLFD